MTRSDDAPPAQSPAPAPGDGPSPTEPEASEAVGLDDADDDAPESAEAAPVRPAFGRLGLVVAIAAGAMTLALQPSFRGSRAPWLIMTVAYAGLTLFALFELRRSGRLIERLRVRPGDTSLGIVLGLALCAGGWFGQRTLAAPGSIGERWLDAVHFLGGGFQTDGLSILLLFLLCAGEETVWRGMVQDELGSWRPRAAPLFTALLYALAVSPSVFLLGPVGQNPLLLLAALGAGLVWSHARRLWPRLFPLVISHLVFTYFMAAPLPGWVFPG